MSDVDETAHCQRISYRVAGTALHLWLLNARAATASSPAAAARASLARIVSGRGDTLSADGTALFGSHLCERTDEVVGFMSQLSELVEIGEHNERILHQYDGATVRRVFISWRNNDIDATDFSAPQGCTDYSLLLWHRTYAQYSAGTKPRREVD